MWEIARKLREKRRDKAKLEFNESDRRIESNCNEIISRKYIASILIEEFMVAANVSTANYLVKNKVT
jgi:exoribonuclease R